MKYLIRKLFALTLVLSMLLSMIPLGISAELVDEFTGYDTLEAIPFEFELEPGDLPFEQLKDATLAAEDIPYCIDPALAEARGHVNRLYLQEPDDYTVMFQNKDGSKTIYVFSHPVKGMTMTTTASIQVNGSVISFSGTNAITSRLSELSDYNIGYSEVAYIPNGVLSADGIDLTEDARGWARGESMPSSLAYNISSEAAAEYAASVTVPDADVSLAAVTPGITITPNDPAPLGGMTVMSISYSDLAGLMSFKNTVTNKYLTLDASSTTLSTSTSRLPLEYSQWAVQYHSTFEYTISSLSDPYNTYLGHNTTESVSIGPLYSATYTFSLNIVSSTNSTVNIYSDEIAIDSDGEIYELSPDESEYPNSCVWQIIDKRVLRLVTSISVPTTIIEQSGVSFIYSNRYSFPQPYPTYYEMELYDATTNQPFEFDTKIYEDDEYWCTVDTPGIYSVYYKDSVSGVTSECFALVIVDSMPASDNNLTYTIQPINNSGLYLTMEANTKTVNSDTVYQADSNTISLTSMSTGAYEELDDISRTFVIEQYSYGFNISATLPTLQYLGVPDESSIDNVSTYNPNYVVDYSLTKLTDQNNALNYSDGMISTKNYTSSGSALGLYPITVADAEENEYYYIIVCGASDDGVLALKYNSSTNYSVEVYTPGQNGFVWKFSQVGVNAPLIKQTTDFWCGYTTVLQALYGNNCDISNFGDTLHQQIEYIAVASTHPNEMAPTYWLDEEINTTLPSLGQNYDNAAGNVPSYDSTKQKIRNSLNNGWTPFFLTDTAGKPYRRTGSGSHFICIVGYDSQSDCVIISNCHFSNQVFGIYTIPYSQFYQAIKCLYWQE